MRVTDRMIFDQATRDAGAARERLEAAVEQASTGVRLVHPGDDPGAAGLLVSSQASAGRFEAVAQGAARASDELGSADAALESVGNALARARELAVQLSSAGYSAADRSSGANEVNGLLSEVLARLNTRAGNRYVFGGNRDGSPPFDAAGNYLGDAGVRQVEIAPGVLQAASVRADVALKGAAGGVDVLATLSALSAALAANDQAGVAATLDALDQGTGQVAEARAQAGISMSAFDTSAAAATAARDGELARSSHLADADEVQAASALALAQRALEASLAAASQGFRLSLLDFLK